MTETIKKLREARKEIWDYLHNSQEWELKDKVIGLIDEAIKLLES